MCLPVEVYANQDRVGWYHTGKMDKFLKCRDSHCPPRVYDRSPHRVPAATRINTRVSPPVVLASPPRLVVIPGSPVRLASETDFNVFVHGGHYYSFHDGVWFHATTHRGPWSGIGIKHVPQPVLAVPVKYYKIPPGHAKKMGGGRHGRNGCPPGLAKQGRC